MLPSQSTATKLFAREGKVKKLTITAAILLFASTASASARGATARWLRIPACSGTPTTLTCTGSAVGLNRSDSAPSFAQVMAGASYTCTNDPTVTGDAFSFIGDGAVGSTQVHNGRRFTLAWSPPAAPNDSEQLGCPGNSWTRGPTYHDVGVGIWQVAEFAFVLFADIGNVEPS
jgi:hypothetical protein